MRSCQGCDCSSRLFVFMLHYVLFVPNWTIFYNVVGSNIEDVAREAGSMDLETSLLQGMTWFVHCFKFYSTASETFRETCDANPLVFCRPEVGVGAARYVRRNSSHLLPVARNGAGRYLKSLHWYRKLQRHL